MAVCSARTRGATLALFLMLGAPARAMSLTVDFDGSGFGHVYHASAPATPTSSCPSCDRAAPFVNRRALAYDAGAAARFNAARAAAFEAQRLREQQEAARLEAERRAAADSGDIEAIDRISTAADGAEEAHIRTQAVFQWKDALPEFIVEQARERQRVDAQLRRLSASIRTINVPSPAVHSLLILGMFATPADEAKPEYQRNPFAHGQPYDAVYGFGFKQPLKETLRAALDHSLRGYDLLSWLTAAQLRQLGRPIHCEDVVAHSNGATIAEVMIRTGILTGVKTLRILGGDASLNNLARLQELANSKGIRIEVYAIKSDPVALLPSGWNIRYWVEQAGLGPTRTQLPDDPVYGVLGLRRQKADPAANLQVHLLDYPASINFKMHAYATYAGILAGQALMGCLGSGSSDRRCVVQ